MVVMGVISGELRAFAPSAVTARSLWAMAFLIVFGSLIGFTAYIYLLGVVSAFGDDKEAFPLMMQKPTISKDRIVFVFAGDLFGEPDNARIFRVDARGRIEERREFRAGHGQSDREFFGYAASGRSDDDRRIIARFDALKIELGQIVADARRDSWCLRRDSQCH